MAVIHLYRCPGISNSQCALKLKQFQALTPSISDLKTELCYNIEVVSQLTSDEIDKIKWLIKPHFSSNAINEVPYLKGQTGSLLIEIGPRLNFSTAFSSNVLSICESIGIHKVIRFEVSVRYLIVMSGNAKLNSSLHDKIVDSLHDKMTECIYENPIQSFDHGIVPENWFIVDIIKRGRPALEEVNTKLGLAFDDWDLDYYCDLFLNKLKRNPTSVECFDLAQSNSEHSRHWFFKGKMFINKIEQKESLIDMIMNTQKFSNQNNVIKFSDNSSAIEGYNVTKVRPERVDEPSSFAKYQSHSHLIFTAETHNFPTGVAPFSGATTGTGGRIRDVQAVGRGGSCIAGTAGYSVGNLCIQGYDLPWEDKHYSYPSNLASPLNILVEASNGASDYGNKFGEPLICGFTRSFGLVSNGERREWVKPIMFSGGLGTMEADMVSKEKPTKGMKVTKIGGPVYRIGVGGGAASSIQVQGDNECALDFGAVQRGDPEMENKLNRLIRACIENKEGNPICSIHDQGAGGNGNVLKELVEPTGAVIFSKLFKLGDNSISTMELWGAEYQESNAILVTEESMKLLSNISKRERCPIDFVGVVTDSGRVVLSEEENPDETKYLQGNDSKNASHPFNLDLELVLGKMPRKEFYMEECPISTVDLSLPSNLSLMNALDRVLRLVSVCSKRFLTNKVDRCVTGLIAQQQCVGPLHTPLADYAVTAVSQFNFEGIATSIGEQPIKGLVNPAAGARMTVAEALTNLMFSKVSSLQDVKCSGNWMWAAKLPGEGAQLYTACKAMCDMMCSLGIAIDGGKDSLSMAARVDGKSIKAPGTLVVSTYAPCPDIRIGVTPDIKNPSVMKVGALLFISLSKKQRLGGSALAQVYSQLGSEVPDVEKPEALKSGFMITQKLISEKKLLSGHDVSDGGLITCLLEMAFAGISGLQIKINSDSLWGTLFSEEVGWVVEVDLEDVEYVTSLYEKSSLLCTYVGQAVGHGWKSMVTVRNSKNEVLLDSSLINLFKMWEETSYQLECKQANIDCVTEEFSTIEGRKGPSYKVTFNPDKVSIPNNPFLSAPRVAVIREEGINGDREMSIAFIMAGFEVWDVCMQDLLDRKVTTDGFNGIIFPGGFSYADVLGSGKGWAAGLLFNKSLRDQLTAFAARKDTFSLGVCNGCQLMAQLGWIGCNITTKSEMDSCDVALEQNVSERFECRFSTVRIEKSPAIMCQGMEGSLLGAWIAHGEGRFSFRNNDVKTSLEKDNCFCIKYTDDDGNPTEIYPMNPNGSQGGLAAICSKDGRHLAMMPHPERCTLMWQWPYVSPSLKNLSTSPWMKLFQNAFAWVQKNST